MKQDVRTNVIPPLKFGEKFGFLTFSTASNVVYQFKSIYYLFFLTNVLKIDVLVAGMILTIGTVWDAVNDPLIGFWSVNHKFKNGAPSRCGSRCPGRFRWYCCSAISKPRRPLPSFWRW